VVGCEAAPIRGHVETWSINSFDGSLTCPRFVSPMALDYTMIQKDNSFKSMVVRTEMCDIAKRCKSPADGEADNTVN
jgi:hypothetical protein